MRLIGFDESFKKRVCSMSLWQTIDLLERDPDLIYVKEEAFDDFPIGQQIRLVDNRKSKRR